MQFEHLIRLSAVDPAAVPVMTRGQLWRGLVLRAESPMLFDENISTARIVSRAEGLMEREITFGSLVVCERIELTPEVEVRYVTQATAQHPGGVRVMRIEEPQEGVLFVRFMYDTALQLDEEMSEAELARLLPYLKSAYQQADMDTAERIVELAAAGQLLVQ